MMNKKISIMALIAIVAVASTFYGMYELNPGVIVSSTSQFIDMSFEENVKQHDLVVIGEVVNIGVRVFPEDIMDIDENGKEYVFEHNEIPKAEITIKILETLKDY